MIIASIIILIVILALNIAGYLFKVYSFAEEDIPTRLKHLFLPGAIIAFRFFSAFIGRIAGDESRSLYFYEKLFVGLDPKREKEKFIAGFIALSFLIISVSIVMFITMNAIFEKGRDISEIERPSAGKESLLMDVSVGGEAFSIDLTVDEAYPSRERMQEMIDEAAREVENNYLFHNKSENEVNSKLNLMSYALNNRVKVSWQSDDCEIVSIDGSINNYILSAPKAILLTATLSAYELEQNLYFRVTVVPKSNETMYKALVEEQLIDTLEENKYSERVVLPKSIGGEEVRYAESKENNAFFLLIAGFILAILMIPLSLSKRNEWLRKRNSQLAVDYPELVSKMAMLLESGMTIRLAFKRIVEDYNKRLLVSKGNKRYVYEEVKKAWNEMQLGMSESLVYERFGRSCGLVFYIRFASLLVQNVKTGNEMLVLQLKREISEARKERQLEIRRGGEVTSAKLMIPMMGLFVIVLVIVLFPAFVQL